MNTTSQPITIKDRELYTIKNVDENEGYKIHLVNKQGTLVTIDMRDGAVTFGEHYTPDEAARVFWESLAMYAPKPVIQS